MEVQSVNSESDDVSHSYNDKKIIESLEEIEKVFPQVSFLWKYGVGGRNLNMLKDDLIKYYSLDNEGVRKLRDYINYSPTDVLGNGSMLKVDVIMLLLKNNGVLSNLNCVFKNKKFRTVTYRRILDELEKPIINSNNLKNPPVICKVTLCGESLVFFHPKTLIKSGVWSK